MHTKLLHARRKVLARLCICTGYDAHHSLCCSLMQLKPTSWVLAHIMCLKGIAGRSHMLEEPFSKLKADFIFYEEYCF